MVRLRYDKEEKVWNNVNEEEKTEQDVQLPGFLIEKLDKAKADLKNDMDVTAICVGAVGSGKSTLMRLCCRYVSDEKFNPRTHIIQDAHDIKSVMKNAKIGDAILIDESSGIFGSADTLTKKTKYANLVLDVCRQKNLFIALCAPYFHRLGSSVAIDRSKFLLRTYYHKKTQKRGSMCYYSEKRKEKLYHFSKKNMGSIKGIKPNWRGNFGEDLTHKELYKEVKDKTLDKVLDSLDGPDADKPHVPTPYEIELEYRKRIVKKNMNTPVKDVATILHTSERTIHRIKADIRKEIEEDLLRREAIPRIYGLKPDNKGEYINPSIESDNQEVSKKGEKEDFFGPEELPRKHPNAIIRTI